MQKVFKIKTSRFVIGLILAGVFFTITFFCVREVKAGIAFAILFIVSGAFNIDRNINTPTKWVIYIIWALVTAFVTCFLSELALNEKILSIGAFQIILSCIICLFLLFSLFAITLHPVISAGVVITVVVFISAVNYYVFQFRGSEIQPADFLSLVTAGDIASEYHFTITSTILYAAVITVIYIFFSSGLPKLEVKHKLRSRLYIFVVDLVLFGTFLLLSKNVSSFSYLNNGTKTNGYILNFSLQLKETFIKKPSPYSVDTIKELGNKYSTTSTEAIIDPPDIVVIMDESFADLSYLGSEIRTNIEITPYIDSLKENTVKGYALASVFGGNTANSEFEFLTGHSLMFFPTGSVAYQQYIKPGDYSMVSELNSLGYTTIGMHPNQGRAWTRNVVYDKFGFDKELFIDSFPDKDHVRNFVSDQEMFETMINKYEEYKKSSNTPLFIYGVTIQNHGSYDYVGDNFQRTVSLQGYSQEYDDVEQYLSVIHETDNAVKYLIEYFSNIENNVVVVFYGDHFPRLNEQFYEEIHGGSFDTLNEQQLKYTVPFFIWTNYDSNEEMVPLTSLNYLSCYVYSVAGLSMPEYNKALLDFMEVIPVLNANGYYSSNSSSFSTMEEADNDIELHTINLYNQLVYNAMMDKKHRNNDFFPVWIE